MQPKRLHDTSFDVVMSLSSYAESTQHLQQQTSGLLASQSILEYNYTIRSTFISNLMKTSLPKLLSAFICLLLALSTFSQTPATALKFDPSLAIDDNSRLNYVSVNNPFEAFQKEMTVEFWMYTPNANLPFGSVMGQSDNNSSNNTVWLMHPNRNGTMTFYVNDAGILRATTGNITANEWHHYAAVSTGAYTKFYVDGVLVHTGDGVSNSIVNNPNSVIHIGKDVRFATRHVGNGDPDNRYATMILDELRIWSRALCVEEINANKNVEINPTGQNGLQEYYRFNQGFVGANNSTVTTLTDLSGNNRNGTLNNFTLNGTSSNWAASGSTNTGIVNAYVPPTAPILGGTSICMGQSTTLTNVNAGGTWTSSNTGVATINATTGQVTTVSSGSTIITYRTACGGVTTTTFTVNAIPSVTIAAVGGTTGCPSSSVTLNATAPNGSTYQWFKNAVLINGASGLSYNATSSGSYTAVVTNNGCVSAVSNAVAITIADVTPPTITCPGNKVLASCDAVIPDYTTSATATDNCTASNSIVITQSPVAGTPIASGATVTVTLTARDASNNTNSCNFTVNRPNITPVAVNDNATVCAGGSVNISVLNNDTHPQGLPLTISDNAVPSVGTLVKNANNTFTYTAPVGYSGPVTFTYTTKANDGTQAFSGNGHYYEFVSAPGISWTAARAAASARTFNGLQGYLVTITSAAENAFMFNKVGTTAWIGGSDAAQEGIWRWMDGPEAGQQFSGQIKTSSCGANVPAQLPNSYHNWGAGEPNDCGGFGSGSGAENYAHFRSDGLWNDFPNGASVSGYAVEYGGLENCLPQLTATATVTIQVTLQTATIAAVGGTSTCPGNSVTLNASAGSTYQWFKDAVVIPNASNASYQATATGSYTAVVTNNGCVSAPSNAITVTIADAVKPSITCPPNQTLNLDATCKATLPDYRSLLTVSDNCTATGSLVITQSPAAGSVVNDKGSMIVAFTVRDASGNESTCTITVDKKDVTDPVISCPAPITVNNTANTCGAVVNFINPTATDNCTGGAFNFWSVNEPNNYQGFNEDYVQLYNNGTWNDLPNSSLNRWIVEFNDIRSNVYSGYTWIGTHGGHTYYYSSSSATWTNARAAAQSIGGDLASINTLAESTFLAPYGGNTWVGGYQDKTVPGFQEPGNASQNYLGWKWVDGTQLGAGQIVITQTAGLPSGSVFPVGVTTNTFIARDESGNESTCSFTVTVLDAQPPVINCPANISVTATSAAGAVVNYTTPVGTDNCSGATTERTAGLASGSTFPIGTTTVTYRVTDAAGLSTQCSFTVTIVGVAPVISCPANITLNAAAGTCAANVNFAATETVGIPASTITYTINGNPVASGAGFPVGTTTVVATATNAVGSSSCSFTVTVVDNQNPAITAPENVQANNTAGLCTGTVALGTPVTSDNCGVASFTNDAPITGIFPVGSTTVIWTVTDIHGNKTTATQTVVIVDNEKPTISVTNVNLNNDAGKCGASIVIAQPETDDNCGVATVAGVRSDNQLLTADYPVGTTTITWTVRDVHGNTNSVVQTIVVTDNEKPVINCAANQVFCANTGGNTQYVIPVLNQSDNCGISSTTYVVTGVTNRNGSGTNASGSFAIGTSIVIYTVTDIHGNISTCSFTVTINPLPVAGINVQSPDVLCNQFTLIGTSTLNGPFGYQWLYNNSPKASTPQLSLGLTDADDVYTLFVTDGNGCRSEMGAAYNYQKQDLSSSYTLLANKEVKLSHYNTVASGSVGIMTNKGEADFKKYTSVNGAGSFVKAPKIDADKGSILNSKIYGVATVTLPTMQYNTNSSKHLRDISVNQNSTVTLTGNYDDVTIKKGANATLVGTVFGKVRLEEGASVKFTSAVVNMEELQIDRGPKSGGYSYVRFTQSTSVRVNGKVSIGNDVIVNPEAYVVTFYMGDKCDDGENFHVKGDDTRITANIYIPNGKIKVTGGNYGGHSSHGKFGHGNDDDDDDKDRCDHRSHSAKDCKHKGHGHHDCNHQSHHESDCRDYVYMTGLFIAEEIHSEGKYVIWNNFSCSASSIPTTAVTSSNNTAIASDETVKTNALTVVTSDEELKVTVMPNPSSTYFTVKLESKYDAPVYMRVVDALGRVVDNRVKLGSNATVQVGHNYQSGTYFAEFIQGNRRKVVQLLKVKR